MVEPFCPQIFLPKIFLPNAFFSSRLVYPNEFVCVEQGAAQGGEAVARD